MADTRVVLITGATGKQGGAVARHLRGKGFKIRAMTRKVDSDAARALAAAGAEVVQGDLNDAASLEAALTGAWGVFGVQNTWESGVEGEEEQGKRLATMARQAGIQHFVYTSVGSAHRQTGIPHFENKWRIEETIRGLGFPSRVIIRPVFFMENLTSPWFLNGDNLCAALDPKTVLQMIAVDDIGKFGARAFTDASALNGREIDLAGDAVTMPQAATILSGSLGRTIHFVRVPIEEVRKNSEDFAVMLEWFDRVGYNADIAGLEREFGIQATKLADWAGRQSG
ncbi:MAG: NmrA/HSCARG family protein [Acidobacteria bacterium]|nr:NmrA/HSCARG family protein [Acidobacteriota bacterium]